MKQIEDNLFRFLRASLWGSSLEGGECDDWDALFSLAREQCVAAPMAEVVGRCCPTDERRRWIGEVLRVEQANLMQKPVIERLSAVFSQMGLQVMLLKGQSAAAAWPNPLRRHCGDIDLYFPRKGDCEKAVEWASSIDAAAAQSADNRRDVKHFACGLFGQSVELHRRIAYYSCARLQQRFDAIVDEMLHPEDGVSGFRPIPPTFFVFHLIVHINHHLLVAGIALRQLCDVPLYIHKYYDEIDFEKLTRWLNDMELMLTANAIGYVAVRRLGFPEDRWPWGVDERWGEFLLKEVFEGGNFGKKRMEYREGKMIFWRKLLSIGYFWNRCRLCAPLMPSETRSYMWAKTKLNIRLLFGKEAER